jgi:hypothetical protein
VSPRCVRGCGRNGPAFAYTSGPLTQTDLDAIDRFEQLLHDAHTRETTVTQPDQTPPTDQPEGVDLAAAGVSGWYEVLLDCRAKKAALDEVEKQARAHIEKALGDHVDGTIDGKPVIRWLHTAAPRTFDKKTFAKDHPDLLAHYTKFGAPGRRFELVDPKPGA